MHSIRYASFLLLIMLHVSNSGANQIREEWKEYGLSKAEWQYVEDSRMPREKLEYLLNAKILPSEYFQYPWLKHDISEQEWINQRKAGILKNEFSTVTNSSKEWAVVQNFFVPGLHQLKRKQTFKGYAMVSTAIISVALYAMHSDPHDGNRLGFDYPGWLVLTGADMLWSSLDIGMQVYKEVNPDAQRFSGEPLRNSNINVCFNVPFSVRTDRYVKNVSQR